MGVIGDSPRPSTPFEYCDFRVILENILGYSIEVYSIYGLIETKVGVRVI